jgi:hypothetical protein
MRPLIFISLLLFLFACNQTLGKKQKSNLKIAINANYTKYLNYPAIQTKLSDSIYYDSIHNQTIFNFDSLRKGEINVFIFSLLTKDIEQKIDLEKDTTIYFDTTFFFNLKNTKSIKDFRTLTSNSSDTIYIGQKVVGCFGGAIEKIEIYKSYKGYNIHYSGFNKQNIEISDSLFNRFYSHFLNESKKLFPDKIGGLTFIHLSTTHIDTYLRQGNNILEFPDLYGWEGYVNFKKDIGIKARE